MEELSHEEFIKRLQTEPLLLGKVAAHNNPQDISANLQSLGLSGGDLPPEDILTVIQKDIKNLKAETVFAILDVEYVFGDRTPQYDQAIEDHVEKLETAGKFTGKSFGEMFPVLKEYKASMYDFMGYGIVPGDTSKKTTTTNGKKPCNGCRARAYMRDERAFYVFIILLAIVIAVVIAKKW